MWRGVGEVDLASVVGGSGKRRTFRVPGFFQDVFRCLGIAIKNLHNIAKNMCIKILYIFRWNVYV